MTVPTLPANVELLQYMLEEKRYKPLCDKLKIAILDKLIEICLDREKDGNAPILSKFDLFLIRDGIEQLRKKEHDADMETLKEVVDRLVERGNSEVPR